MYKRANRRHGGLQTCEIVNSVAPSSSTLPRLGVPSPLPTTPGTKELFSDDAAERGIARRKQGYSAAMMVESRMLQVSIFKSLDENLDYIAFPLLLPDVMTIANEVDAQLSRAVACYVAESRSDGSLLSRRGVSRRRLDTTI